MLASAVQWGEDKTGFVKLFEELRNRRVQEQGPRTLISTQDAALRVVPDPGDGSGSQ